jgi:hypothetical protein
MARLTQRAHCRCCALCRRCRYPWGIFRQGNTLADYLNAYKHVVDVLRSTGANFVYQQSYNAKSSRDDQTPFLDMYVGDEYADMICVSLYNFGNNPGRGAGKPFADLVDPFYSQVRCASYRERASALAQQQATHSAQRCEQAGRALCRVLVLLARTHCEGVHTAAAIVLTVPVAC